MGRFWLGVVLLAAILGLSLCVTVSADRVHRPISQALEQAAECGLTGELEKGAALAQQAKSIWQSHWHSTATFADHAPMDEIDGLFAQLDAFVREGRSADFAACCARLASLISAVAEAHSPAWWNVLAGRSPLLTF